MEFCFIKLPCVLVEALLFSSFFLEKNEAKKSLCLSNRSAFKGVRHNKGTLCVINVGCVC